MYKQRKTAKTIRILISDTSPMASGLLVEALCRETSFEMLEPVPPGELTNAVAAARPDIVVTSINTDENPYGGCDIAREFRDVSPETRCIFLLDKRKRDAVLQAFQAGARGVFCRTESVQLLRKCIMSVSEGQIWANASEIGFALEALIQLSVTQLTRPKINKLFTSREQQVLNCIAQGLSNREIADRLGLSEHTVKNYVFRMFDKLGVSNRVELLVCSLTQSFLEPRHNEVSVNDKPAVALESCLHIAQRFATTQCVLHGACDDGLSDMNDRIAAAVWTLVSERICAAILHSANFTIEKFVAELSKPEREEATRRAEDWLSKNVMLRRFSAPETLPEKPKLLRTGT
jgi:two-component system, NarL family, nitrate/nitrite response regulator NarL